MRYAVNENAPHLLSLGHACQHILFVTSGTVFLPILLYNQQLITAAEANFITFSSLMLCGISVVIQAYKIGTIGSGYLLFMGTSGAFFACTMDAIQIGGLGLVALMACFSAPCEFLVGYFIRHLRKVFTSSIGGTVIMLIAVSIVPITLNMWMGDRDTANPQQDFTNLYIGLATFLPMLALSFGSLKTRTWGSIIGIATGYLFAGIIGANPMTATLQAPWIGFDIQWPGINWNFEADWWPILIVYIFATLAGSIETFGDAITCEKLSVRNYKKPNYKSVQGALYADGTGNFLAGLMGTIPNTTFSGNIALIGMSKVASRRIALYACLLFMICALSPKIRTFILGIPPASLGAATFFLMCILFYEGLKLVISDVQNFKTTVVVSLSFWTGVAAENDLLFPHLFSDRINLILSNGITTGGMCALILTLISLIRFKRPLKLRVAKQPQSLDLVFDFVDAIKHQMKLSSQSHHDLRLCCEEVFQHLLQNEKRPDDITIKLSREEESVLVEFHCGSSVEDVDFENFHTALLKFDPEQNPELIGLILLNKVAGNVRHLYISGHTYISFEVLMQREAHQD
ncbi:MAG: uracil-xanthine permease family protein [Gammaproteobacteria bacterium]